MFHKPRTPKPKKKPLSKLKPEDVVAIRAALQAGVSKAVLGRRYNVTTSAIYRIEHGQAWKKK